MLTALVCWLPLAVAYTAYFVKTRVKLRDVIGGGVILVVLYKLLNNMQTPLRNMKMHMGSVNICGW